MLTKAVLNNQKYIKNIVKYYYSLIYLIYSWIFSNHYSSLIPCWKQLCCLNYFVETTIRVFQDLFFIYDPEVFSLL